MIRLYRSLQAGRDWVFAKIDYVQSESAKWQRLWGLVKGTVSLARAHPGTATVIVGMLGLGGGYAANETIFDGPSFARGDSGVYAAPLDSPIFYSDKDNTLRLDLGATPVGEIVIENITVGTAFTGSTLPSGETEVVILGGLPDSTGFTETFLEVGYLTIDRWRCTQLILSDIEVHELNVKWNSSDGQSISAVAGTPRARAIGGGYRADSMTTSGGTYDQLVIQAATSAVNGQVDVMTLSNIYSKGGPCALRRIKAGTIDIIYNEIGAGDGFSAKDFTIASSVVYKSFTNTENTEVSISPP